MMDQVREKKGLNRAGGHNALRPRVMMVVLLASFAANAFAATRVKADVDAGALADALTHFSLQAGVTITVDADLVRGKRAPVLKGDVTVEEGFERLLLGSGFHIVRTPVGYALVPDSTSVQGKHSSAVAGAVTQLAEVRVTAVAPVQGSNKVVASERLQRNQAADVADVFRDESSVVVGGGSRQAQRIYVRGIEASNLNVTVDGAVQGRNLFQHRGNIGGINPDLIKQVEVQTLPSADQGAGALGGSIRYETVDAQDLLDSGREMGATVKSAYGSVDQSKQGSLSVYGLLDEHLGVLANINANNFDNYKSGAGATVHGSAGQDRDYFVKLSLLDFDGHSVRIASEKNTNSGLYRSSSGDGAYDPNATLSYQISERRTHTVDHRYRRAGNDWVDWKLNAFVNNLSLENLTSATQTESEGLGINARNTAQFALGSSRHHLTTGADFYTEKGIQTAATGAQVGGDNLTRNLGVYAQERLMLGRVQLSLGARHDRYQTDFGSTRIEGHETSPNAGLEVQIAGGLQGFAGYGEAVRSTGIIPIQWLSATTATPTFNTQTGKESYGKAFEPESSRQAEAGFRYNVDGFFKSGDRVETGMTYFHTEIENLIQQIGGSQGKPVAGFYNDDPITSKGFEIRAAWKRDGFRSSLAFTHADTVDKDGKAVAVTRRKGGSTGDRLNWDSSWKVHPELNLGYTLNAVAGVHRDTVDRAGYTLHHLQAQWEPASVHGLAFSIAVRNLFDKQYSEQTSIGTDATAVPEPGRDIRLSASYRF